MLMRIMRLEGGEGDQRRLSSVDCALQALRREIHSNDVCVCGDPMELAINMVIGSGDGSIKKKPPRVGIAGEPYFPPVISIVKRGARSFFTILVFF